jgi:hypothetical protein
MDNRDKAIIVSSFLISSTYMVYLFRKLEQPISPLINGFVYGVIGTSTLAIYLISVQTAIKLLSEISTQN